MTEIAPGIPRAVSRALERVDGDVDKGRLVADLSPL